MTGGIANGKGVHATGHPGGPLIAGTAVILTGEWLEAALQAVLIAARARARNGLANSAAHLALAKALTVAMSEDGHSDVREIAGVQDLPYEQPTVTVAEAAKQLKLSERQIRRRAPQLGGRRVGGVWLLDQDAIDEHRKGQKWTETA
jgi:hypothetical protein